MTEGVVGFPSELIKEGFNFFIDNKIETLNYKIADDNDENFSVYFNIFDKWVMTLKSALIIPITGFAHSMTSSALDYKNEGLILGIGANIFKLAGSVILYGIVSVYIFGLIRVLLGV